MRGTAEVSTSDALAIEAGNGSAEASEPSVAKLEATIAELRAQVRAYESVFYRHPNPAVIFAQSDLRILGSK
jgi:hypothetical protein